MNQRKTKVIRTSFDSTNNSNILLVEDAAHCEFAFSLPTSVQLWLNKEFANYADLFKSLGYHVAVM